MELEKRYRELTDLLVMSLSAHVPYFFHERMSGVLLIYEVTLLW